MDVKVFNENSSKTFEKFGIVKLVNRPWEIANNFGEYLHGTVGTNTETVVEVVNPLPATEMDALKNNTHPCYSITKVGESDEVKVKLMFFWMPTDRLSPVKPLPTGRAMQSISITGSTIRLIRRY
ncbi:hypothetical protein AGMMS4957_09850 [Bacteroidia bacterium]|nr:hypothetical protein AGMMS4957_09850 [Bacteroidia bacterium]